MAAKGDAWLRRRRGEEQRRRLDEGEEKGNRRKGVAPSVKRGRRLPPVHVVVRFIGGRHQDLWRLYLPRGHHTIAAAATSVI